MTPEFDVVVVSAGKQHEMVYEPSGNRYFEDVDRAAVRSMFPPPELPDLVRLTLLNNTDNDLRWSASGYHSDDHVWPTGTRTMHVGHNAGWVRAANAGLSLATAPHVVLCNDDIVVRTEGWLEKLREPFLEDEHIAAVGPRSTPNQGVQGHLEDGKGWCYAQPCPDADFCIGWWPLSFFCVMLSQDALRDVGLLDLELADGYGGDDDDWQRRAWERDWKFAYQSDVLVEHEGNQTFGERKAQLQPGNIEYLRMKWGRA